MLSPLTGSLGPLGFLKPSGGFNYLDFIVNTHGAAEVWKLSDATNAAIIPASVNSDRNGTSSGLTLQDTTNPIASDNGLAPLFTNGTGNHVALSTTSFASLFSGGPFTFVMWFKMLNASIWSDGLIHYLLDLSGPLANAAGTLRVLKVNNANNTLRTNLFLNGVLHQMNIIAAIHGNPTDWVQWAISYQPGISAQVSLNGVVLSTTSPSIANTWNDMPASTFDLGRAAVGLTQNHSGWLAWLSYFNQAKSESDLADMYTKRTEV